MLLRGERLGMVLGKPFGQEVESEPAASWPYPMALVRPVREKGSISDQPHYFGVEGVMEQIASGVRTSDLQPLRQEFPKPIFVDIVIRSKTQACRTRRHDPCAAFTRASSLDDRHLPPL